MSIYINPHNDEPMKSVYVDPIALREWNNGWLPDLIDYSKPLGVMSMTVPCTCKDNACIVKCRYHILTYQLIQHELYPDGVIIQCPMRFTRSDI